MESRRIAARIILENNLNRFLHHFHILEGDRAVIVPELIKFLEEKMGISVHGNPDVSIQEFESFSIDDGRELKKSQSRKNIDAKKQIFILAFHFISHEAQNALLKVLEEPSQNTYFFIVIPNTSSFLETIISRAQIIKFPGTKQSSDYDIAKFLSSSGAKRLQMLQKIIDEKNKSQALFFLNSLIEILNSQRKKTRTPYSYEEIMFLADIEQGRKYLFDRGPYVKMILEHIALTIPFQKI